MLLYNTCTDAKISKNTKALPFIRLYKMAYLRMIVVFFFINIYIIINKIIIKEWILKIHSINDIRIPRNMI